MATVSEMLQAFRSVRDRIKFVALTGGPCGGKSKFLLEATRLLEVHGYKVILVPELARELIAAGFDPRQGPWKNHSGFQKQLLLATLEKKYRYLQLLLEMDLSAYKGVVFLCDRGYMDGAAYVGKVQFEAILQEAGLNPASALDFYDLVVHLVTAAHGKEEFYVNDPERPETPEQARRLDDATVAAWLGHMHHQIVDNSTDFEGKINNALRALRRTLNMPTTDEIEPKFIVTNFSPALIPQGAECFQIRQTYLDIPGKTGIECRVRAKSTAHGDSFYYTEKVPTNVPGKRHESEPQISKEEYLGLKVAHTFKDTQEIVKTRYKFPYGSYVCELDLYQGILEGLVILEIEVKTVEEMKTVPKPPQFDLVDVTGDHRFLNRGLAEIGRPSELADLLKATLVA
ncbi:MAG TPA: AAA family ATPase [Candidatus Paceibacterota bacterium]